MITRPAAVLLAIVVALAGACEEEEVIDAECSYEEIGGIAEIVSIDQPLPGELNCPKGSAAIYFDFIPHDTTAVLRYTGNWPASNARLLIGGMNPSEAWIDDQGLRVGLLLECVRMQITKGTCAPIVYTYPDLDLSRFNEFCY
jgi:hypothetical protein